MFQSVVRSFLRDLHIVNMRFTPAGIVLSGSHMSAYEESTDRAPKAVFEIGVPVLCICYGMQTMAEQLGGKVESGAQREFGYAEVREHGSSKPSDSSCRLYQ